MKALASRPGFAPMTIGSIILLHLAAFALFLSANLETVSFLGNVLPETCSWKTVYGIPCPTCGMTRGVVLALHGQLTDSFEVNRSAPILAASALLIGCGLFLAGYLRLRNQAGASAGFSIWTQRVGLTGGGLWLLMLAVNWTLVLRALP